MRRAGETTTDHDTIVRWAEEHGGKPTRVKGTGGRRGKGDVGMIRIDFPGFSGEGKLEEISWDQWLDAFDANGLALVYRPGDRFNKLVARETVAAGRAGKPVRSARRQPARKKAASGARAAKPAATAAKRAARAAKPAARAGARKTQRSAAARRPAARKKSRPSARRGRR